MTRFEPVPLPGTTPVLSPSALRSEISVWVSSEPLAALLRGSGCPPLPLGDLHKQLTALVAFVAGAWDFRRNRERDQIDSSSFPPPRLGGLSQEIVLEASEALGLVNAITPRESRYNGILVLGGLAVSCYLRPKYASYLMSLGLSAPRVSALTAFRRLSPVEMDWLATQRLPLRGSEHEVMSDGMEMAFLGRGPEPNGKSQVPLVGLLGPDAAAAPIHASEKLPSGTVLELAVAPSVGPEQRRSNTRETYSFWAKRSGLQPGEELLLVTSPIYVPYQHVHAVQHLAMPYSCRVETVGIDFPAIIGSWDTPRYGPANYLQELKSMINSLYWLESELPQS